MKRHMKGFQRLKLNYCKSGEKLKVVSQNLLHIARKNSLGSFTTQRCIICSCKILKSA